MYSVHSPRHSKETQATPRSATFAEDVDVSIRVTSPTVRKKQIRVTSPTVRKKQKAKAKAQAQSKRGEASSAR